MENPLKAPDRYQYTRSQNPFGESAMALNETGLLLGVVTVHEMNVPFVPNGIKNAIHEVRMRRAEVKAAQQADRRKARWNRKWVMNSV